MANTITTTGNVTCLTAIDTNWTWTDTFSAADAGIRVTYIMFIPHVTDIWVLKNVNISGATLAHIVHSNANDQRTIYFDGERVRPYLDVSGSSLDSTAQLIIKRA